MVTLESTGSVCVRGMGACPTSGAAARRANTADRTVRCMSEFPVSDLEVRTEVYTFAEPGFKWPFLPLGCPCYVANSFSHGGAESRRHGEQLERFCRPECYNERDHWCV